MPALMVCTRKFTFNVLNSVVRFTTIQSKYTYLRRCVCIYNVLPLNEKYLNSVELHLLLDAYCVAVVQ